MNEISLLFSKLGIDTYAVLEAAKTKWNFIDFKPGLVGGHCIGVDPYYLTNIAQHEKCELNLIYNARLINEAFSKRIAERFIVALIKNNILPRSARVGVLGVTFKENVSDTRNSKVEDLITELIEWGIQVQLCDPNLSSKEIGKRFSNEVFKLEDNVNFDAIIVAVAHDQFKTVSPLKFKKWCAEQPQPVFFDLKSIYDQELLIDAGFSILTL